jgi:hypothetical protein
MTAQKRSISTQDNSLSDDKQSGRSQNPAILEQLKQSIT